MDLGLRDRVAILCGAADEVARACAVTLDREGALVVVADPGAEPPDAVVDAALARHGRVDIVVFVAPEVGPLALDAPEDDLYEMWDPVLDAIRVYQAALPSMRERRWGRIVAVTTTGVRAVVDDAEELDLVAGLGLLGLHKVIASEEGANAVTVNAVLRAAASVADDVAAAVAFLASDRAGYLSGITLAVDAGVTPSIF